MSGTVDDGKTRRFESGATRDTSASKPDYEGFNSPLVEVRFGEYMHKNRLQSDGKLRDSDNWQKGIPKDVYMKSLHRHFLDMWLSHRGRQGKESLEEALCALRFNVNGYLHELLREREYLTMPDGEQTGNDVLQKRAQEVAAGLASREDEQQVPRRDGGRVVQRHESGPVDRVQIPDTSQAELNAAEFSLERSPEALANQSIYRKPKCCGDFGF